MTEQQRRGVKLAASAVVLAGSGFFIWNSLAQTGMASRANTRVFICTDCEGTFRYKIKMGDIEPLPCKRCNKEAAYGADHSDVAVTLTNLGNVYQQLGHFDEAQTALERAHLIFIQKCKLLHELPFYISLFLLDILNKNQTY